MKDPETVEKPTAKVEDAALRRANAQATIDAFHRLYYDSKEATWRNTNWLGVGVQKCPLDLWIYQEIVYEVRPDVIIECGTYGGGSALFLSSLCDLIGNGRVYTIDIQEHEGRELPVHPRLEYLRGSTTSEEVLAHLRRTIVPGETTMVILDSDHSCEHVVRELEAYASFVTPGSYLILEDTNINGHPVLESHGPGPMEALKQFETKHPEFEIDRSREKLLLTFNPRGYLRRRGEGASREERPVRSVAKERLPEVSYEIPIDLHKDTPKTRALRAIGTGKRVLELGCAGGIMSAELSRQGCTVVGVEMSGAAGKAAEACERVVRADLSQVGWDTALNGELFDVAVATDVLEHLPDPASCLRVLRRFLRPGGFVIASIPNIAHASMRLSLLSGRFDYRDLGLLDRTHLRFYARRGIEELFDSAGFAVRHLETIHLPVEGTEIPIDQDLVPADLLRWLSEDEDATTYEFFVIAEPLRHGSERGLRQRVRSLIAELEALKGDLKALAFPRAGNVDLSLLNDETRRAVLELRARVVDLNRQLGQKNLLIERIQHETIETFRSIGTLRETIERKDAEIRLANDYSERVNVEATRYAESLREALKRAEEGWGNAHQLLVTAEQKIAQLEARLHESDAHGGAEPEAHLRAQLELRSRNLADALREATEKAELAQTELAKIHSSRLWKIGTLYWRARKAAGFAGKGR